MYPIKPNLWVPRVDGLGPVHGKVGYWQRQPASVGTDSTTITKVKVGFEINYGYVAATTRLLMTGNF